MVAVLNGDFPKTTKDINCNQHNALSKYRKFSESQYPCLYECISRGLSDKYVNNDRLVYSKGCGMKSEKMADISILNSN